jgi:hypothetical protein
MYIIKLIAKWGSIVYNKNRNIKKEKDKIEYIRRRIKQFLILKILKRKAISILM